MFVCYASCFSRKSYRMLCFDIFCQMFACSLICHEIINIKETQEHNTINLRQLKPYELHLKVSELTDFQHHYSVTALDFCKFTGVWYRTLSAVLHFGDFRKVWSLFQANLLSNIYHIVFLGLFYVIISCYNRKHAKSSTKYIKTQHTISFTTKTWSIAYKHEL